MRKLLISGTLAALLSLLGLFYLQSEGFTLVRIENVGSEVIDVSVRRRGSRLFEARLPAHSSRWFSFTTQAETGLDIDCVGQTTGHTLELRDMGYFYPGQITVEEISLNACGALVSMRDIWTS
jgi:hypothetical protein